MAEPEAEESALQRIGLLRNDGAALAAIPEWTPAWIEARIPPEQWQGAALTCHGAPLPLSVRLFGGAPRVVAEWPRAGPGHYALQLTTAGVTETRRITIHPHKISEAAYAYLLEDLETRLPATVAIALQRAGGLAGVTLPPPGETTLAQELQRLREAILGSATRPGLALVLREIARDPHQVLHGDERWVRQERSRRPQPALLALALARAGNLDETQRPQRVVDARAVESVDVYENRLLQAFCTQVEVRLRRLTLALGTGPAHVEATALLDTLRAARRQAAFLDEVRLPADLTTHLTMVLIKRPAYRAALEGYLAFRRSIGVRLEHPGLDAPLENLPSLYQTWGTLHTLAALLDAAADMGYRVARDRLVARDAGGFYVRVLPNGEPALELRHPEHAIAVAAIPERTYRREVGELHSVSYDQRPDLAVEIRRPDAPVALYLFDPKYKLDGEAETGDQSGQPTKTDIDKMHAYRDAIRDHDNGRVVTMAAILYPGRDFDFGPDVLALRAYPSSELALKGRLREIFRQALQPVASGIAPASEDDRTGAAGC
ncbi:MAG: DUF2357 domain-containing protein [Thermomicrobiales bacterium]